MIKKQHLKFLYGVMTKKDGMEMDFAVIQGLYQLGMIDYHGEKVSITMWGARFLNVISTNNKYRTPGKKMMKIKPSDSAFLHSKKSCGYPCYKFIELVRYVGYIRALRIADDYYRIGKSCKLVSSYKADHCDGYKAVGVLNGVEVSFYVSRSGKLLFKDELYREWQARMGNPEFKFYPVFLWELTPDEKNKFHENKAQGRSEGVHSEDNRIVEKGEKEGHDSGPSRVR